MFRMITVLAAVLMAALAGISAQAQTPPIQTDATHAIIMDFETGLVLFEHNADEQMPPASMSKLMTALMVFERVDDGRLSLDDEFTVSEDAWRRGGAATEGSTMFLELGSRVSVRDLLHGVIVQSGNDACIVLAQGISGSEDAFAAEMNARAEELGLTNSTFRNATGWPDPEHRVSARDLAVIARVIIRDHPELYGIYAESEFTWNGIRQYNRNPLLGTFDGADGLKTGHTEESGYGLVASAERNGARRIVVFNGMDSNSARAREAERLMRAAFSEFNVATLFEAGDALDVRAPVMQGRQQEVALRVAEDLVVGYHRRAGRNADVAVVLDGAVRAPIAEGDRVGSLVVTLPGAPDIEVPVLAAESVERVGPVGRALDALVYLIRTTGTDEEAELDGE